MPRYLVHDSGPLAILDTRPDDAPPSLVLASSMLGGLLFSVIPEKWSHGAEGDYWKRELTKMVAKLNAREDAETEDRMPHPIGDC